MAFGGDRAIPTLTEATALGSVEEDVEPPELPQAARPRVAATTALDSARAERCFMGYLII
jgi:hypothetical protein